MKMKNERLGVLGLFVICMSTGNIIKISVSNLSATAATPFSPRMVWDSSYSRLETTDNFLNLAF